ncbi:sodium- and chloride-dependent neutral and basic amino acid transporter B(0+)-like [Helicoverpa zea]|uniref:sodium- and chloride-dependent neutral and basic amino acid transporter B(0+)-like n=1 Tax=Helicoverpa zea TaxID=7113 RepID=UPI001F5A69F8|nr:sodium- and chloride-dependent neutral and basic amino acid transporter B(0+)-like [Helicoverpa zea]
MAGKARHENSMETILTFDRDVQSNWSVVWSTSHITDMDNATARTTRVRVRGRRRMRLGSLALSALMTMHCRVSASALTSGFFFFMVFLIVAVASLANPLRHFEIYLGQWSLSGPGRAFRIIPMLDGIGIAMCINAIVRAVTCCSIAAIAAMYVIHSVADAKLPFTYCRDYDLNSYEPELKEIKQLSYHGPRFSIGSPTQGTEDAISTMDFFQRAWRNVTFTAKRNPQTYKVKVCNETFPGKYPALFSTPAYNFFYVEVVQYRSEHGLGNFNLPLLVVLIFTWLILWSIMVVEKLSYGRLIWNNIRPWLLIVPWLWTLLLAGTAASNLTLYKTISKAFRAFGTKQFVAGVADAFEVALYIHSVSVGTELIHGKGLNRFASGHVDPSLNSENVWHSCIVLMLTALHSATAAMCALVDYVQFNLLETNDISESTLWMLPMYSKCTSLGSYSHLVTALVFGGLMVSYMTVSFVLLKTALHTIFEYRVKFVSVEQGVVAILMLTCMCLSLLVATNGGLPLLESLDALMTGVAMPLVVLLELVSLMYVYRSHDFQSDINLATEENTCASRLGIQWQIIPFLTAVALVLKLTVLANAELPSRSMCLAAVPVVMTILALPLRAAHNAYKFLHASSQPST